nr:reverse transcriptase domain-containing protein [Tanacetum cinerariifolium]
MCEEEDPFTPRIRIFESSRRTRMPNNVKTYDGTGDPEDHVKKFQAAAQVERLAMPTWCHMFNSTLIGAARDPVEIYNIKQKDGETIKDFMERFKVETGRMKGAPECMRISKFMHGAPGDHRRRQSFHKSLDEFHDCKVVVALQRTMLIPAECTSVITSSAVSKKERTCPDNFKVALHPEFPDQEVAIGGTLSDKGHIELCSILKKNLDIFAWQPSDMTGVSRSVAEHRLNIWE